MMKSFGTFTGGAFLYWEYDDGSTPMNQLSLETAKTCDSYREMILFDGGRCHAVDPCEGEFYSLVHVLAACMFAMHVCMFTELVCMFAKLVCMYVCIPSLYVCLGKFMLQR